MRPVAIVAAQAESALGSGRAAYDVGSPGATPESAVRRDAELEVANLRRPQMARAAHLDDASGEQDRAFFLVRSALSRLAIDLDRLDPEWRSQQVGLCIGTSSGAMLSLCAALDRLAAGHTVSHGLARASPYFGPLGGVEGILGIELVEEVQVLAACASSAIALGLASRWLNLGRADLVIAGGYDAVSVFVAAGFESLGATTGGVPAPFRAGRDGMVLGEASAFLALRRQEDAPSPAFGYITGFAATSDAVHVTAPDRTGRGLARAGSRALMDAQLSPSQVGLVSAHATATPFNDAAEARALSAVLGEQIENVVVHPFKAVVGHTLGASAALEALAAIDAMQRGVLPAAVGDGALDEGSRVRLVDENLPGEADHCLKLSAAFGGANAALVCSRRIAEVPKSYRARAVGLLAVGALCEALDSDRVHKHCRMDQRHLLRLDRLSELCIGAVSNLLNGLSTPLPPDSAVVVGTAAATIEHNARFYERLQRLGARMVEPRRFPATSPNLAPGQVSIAFGLNGPTLAVGASVAACFEAVLVGYDLVAAGDADTALVIAAEEVGPVVRALWPAAGWSPPKQGACALCLAASGGRPLTREALRTQWARARRADFGSGPAELLGALAEL